MLDKLSLEDLERISIELGKKNKTHEEKQNILTTEAQKLVREGLASPENLTQFGVGKFVGRSMQRHEGRSPRN